MSRPAHRSLVTVAALVATIVFTEATHAGVIDGLNIPTDFAGHLVATQGIATAWGDDNDFDQVYGGGSELDQLFVNPSIGGGELRVGLTGNLEPAAATNSWNSVVLFLDTRPGGENLLDENGQGAPDVLDFVPSLQGTRFDDGFFPDFAITVNAGNPDAPDTYYVNVNDLAANTSAWLGIQTLGAGTGELTGVDPASDWQVAFDNSNVFGVLGDEIGSPDTLGLAATADTGLELVIPIADLDLNPGYTLGIQAMISTQGAISNQNLPTLPDFTPGHTAPVDFGNFAGDQFAQVLTVPEPASMALLIIAALAVRRR